MEAWKVIAKTTDKPSVLIASRQKLPVLDETKGADVEKGAYIISPAKTQEPDGILLASGSEVSLALEVKAKLQKQGDYDIQVVSVPSIERFKEQSADYQEQVLPTGVRHRLAVEMGNTQAWYQFVGLDGRVVGVDTLGKSGKGPEVVADYGFTVDHVVDVFNKMWEDQN
ncbi:transketolase-like TK C-terminal-containing protein [Limosilactobacillus fermentum]|uniref:transketolase-like TK C-terminal-containing protein n=1 Tax=Limosilactobacillus fermentum TaxID=1613 RepID=UPI0021CB03CC|nr:transketolase C-terminal domain-containing protein [Limosilactobacillus fermentum]